MVQRLRDALLGIDPALTNTRVALRGTLSVVLSFFAISLLAKTFRQAPTLAFLGVIIALMGSMAVNDPTVRQQKVTMALLPLPTSLAFMTSILLGTWPPLRLLVFLMICFTAVWIRRFGIRWMGLGLAMVKNIVESAGGKIWFETKQNVGTTFFVEMMEIE